MGLLDMAIHMYILDLREPHADFESPTRQMGEQPCRPPA
jgi:hypothetical protein